ncbi:hypothetical protein [Aestuariivita boseongensis]|uniref:hypothetical protein n=1 Tax=Aestuariivita boseongensis TaxID=1470562 RepID=UPI0006828E82|nr:hypothetical protein [Aestuariivita boseongensis]
MSQTHATEAVLNQLSLVLDSDRFPDEAKALGARLLDRLRSPVQIVVLGKPQSGKSRLINMLLGHAIYPQIADLDTCEIVYGEAPRVFVIREDDTIQHWTAGPDVPFPDDTVMVRVELPLPVLNKFNLTEVTLSGTSAAQRDMATWACDRADVALWCTQSFDAIERALWAPARDALKDHSFLVITKADQLLMKGVLQDHIASLEEIVAQEFHSLYSVATIQAISARTGPEIPDSEVWSASGGHALHEAVLKLVDTGRRADTDNALLFLSRYSAVVSQIERMRGETRETQDETVRKISVIPETAEAMGKAQRNREVFVEALDYLQDRAEKLISSLDSPGNDSTDAILEHCLDTANQLSTLLQDFDQSDPSLAELQEEVMESADMMVLLQLEKSEDAVSDAVTLLLQLKKEVAEKTAG